MPYAAHRCVRCHQTKSMTNSDVRHRDHLKNEDIRQKTDIIVNITSSKWSWAGHLARQSEERCAKRLLSWTPRQAKGPADRHPKRWKDDI